MLGAAAVVGGSRGWSLERTAEVTTRNARDALDPQRWGRLDLSGDLSGDLISGDLSGDLVSGDLSLPHGTTSQGQRQPSAAEQRAAAAGLLDPMLPIGGDVDNY